jgi:hypothetical protein
MRFWGIADANSYDYYQLELPIRNFNDQKYAQSYYDLNKKLLALLKKNIIDTIKKEKPLRIEPSNTIIDCQIINVSHHFKNMTFPKGIEIIDYSSLGHRSLLLSDLMYIVQAFRGIIRNLKFKCKYSPGKIWHWDDFAKQSNKKFLKFGWQNEFLDTSLIQKYAQKFMKMHANFYPELTGVDIKDKIFVIAPEVGMPATLLDTKIRSLLYQNEALNKQFHEASIVLIKQHKACYEEYSSIIKLNEVSCIVAKTPELRVMPIEIILFAFKNSILISAPSSTIFSNKLVKFNMLAASNKNYYREYGLMIKRYHLKLHEFF